MYDISIYTHFNGRNTFKIPKSILMKKSKRI